MGMHIKSITGSVVIEQRGELCKVWIFEDGFIKNDGLLSIDYASINETIAMMTADQAIAHFAAQLQSSRI
jgi:hypothetical protein